MNLFPFIGDRMTSPDGSEPLDGVHPNESRLSEGAGGVSPVAVLDGRRRYAETLSLGS